MMIHEARRLLMYKLADIYDSGEAGNIADIVVEHITGLDKKGRIANAHYNLSSSQIDHLQNAIARLTLHEPVQYVLNECWFCGLKFYVDKNVLIPRPETEELVEWIVSNLKFPLAKLKILDIGSGSGCIPVTIKRKFRKADVWSCDVSDAALNVAKLNASNLGADVHFVLLDFLRDDERDGLPVFDIIVSNPPYVPQKDRLNMQSNVVDYEPHTALFVPDNDPLVFYKSIAAFGKTNLSNNGQIFLEVYVDYAEAVKNVFLSAGYLSVEIKMDMQGKERMIRVGF
jgi:release factor glutamine methyltransferase